MQFTQYRTQTVIGNACNPSIKSGFCGRFYHGMRQEVLQTSAGREAAGCEHALEKLVLQHIKDWLSQMPPLAGTAGSLLGPKDKVWWDALVAEHQRCHTACQAAPLGKKFMCFDPTEPGPAAEKTLFEYR